MMGRERELKERRGMMEEDQYLINITQESRTSISVSYSFLCPFGVLLSSTLHTCSKRCYFSVCWDSCPSIVLSYTCALTFAISQAVTLSVYFSTATAAAQGNKNRKQKSLLSAVLLSSLWFQSPDYPFFNHHSCIINILNFPSPTLSFEVFLQFP